MQTSINTEKFFEKLNDINNINYNLLLQKTETNNLYIKATINEIFPEETYENTFKLSELKEKKQSILSAYETIEDILSYFIFVINENKINFTSEFKNKTLLLNFIPPNEFKNLQIITLNIPLKELNEEEKVNIIMKEILKLHENEKKYIQRIEDLFQRLKEQQQEIKLLKEEKNK
jgi:hypothetical protein